MAAAPPKALYPAEKCVEIVKDGCRLKACVRGNIPINLKVTLNVNRHQGSGTVTKSAHIAREAAIPAPEAAPEPAVMDPVILGTILPEEAPASLVHGEAEESVPEAAELKPAEDEKPEAKPEALDPEKAQPEVEDLVPEPAAEESPESPTEEEVATKEPKEENHPTPDDPVTFWHFLSYATGLGAQKITVQWKGLEEEEGLEWQRRAFHACGFGAAGCLPVAPEPEEYCELKACR